MACPSSPAATLPSCLSILGHLHVRTSELTPPSQSGLPPVSGGRTSWSCDSDTCPLCQGGVSPSKCPGREGRRGRLGNRFPFVLHHGGCAAGGGTKGRVCFWHLGGSCMEFWISTPYDPDGYSVYNGRENEKSNIFGVHSVAHVRRVLL